MKEGPSIARIAALLGDTARADALTALMTDRALTATELAAVAGVTKQTMSAHLSKLLDASLITVDQQGRHRYFRLANEDVASLLESAYESLVGNDLFEFSALGLRPSAAGIGWFKSAGIDTELVLQQRRALCRPCMDWSERRYHLAGSLGAALLARVCALGWAKREKASRVLRFSAIGERQFRNLVNAKSPRQDN
jgi:DNA-binding transcriptional ArsR family regulator